MAENAPQRRRLVGNTDLVWFSAIFITCAVVTSVMFEHLRTGNELARLDRELAYEGFSSRELELERRALETELELEWANAQDGRAANELADRFELRAPGEPVRVVQEQP